jgi:methyl-accepting chemotaxis protein
MDSIAQRSADEAAAIEEISAAVRQMDEMTQHNASLVEQTNAAIAQTEVQARRLDGVVEVFLIDSEGALDGPASGTARRDLGTRPAAAPRPVQYLRHRNMALAAE